MLQKSTSNPAPRLAYKRLIAAMTEIAAHPATSAHMRDLLNTLTPEVQNELLALADQHSSLSPAEREQQTLSLLVAQAWS